MIWFYADTETFNEKSINGGSHRYAETAEIMVFAYAVDDGPVMVCDLTAGDTLPRELYSPDTYFVFHNSAFDRPVIQHSLGVYIPPERVHDTMVQARTLGLPGSLDTLCDILKITSDQAKDKRGKELIQLFCKPRPAKNHLRRATRETHPEEWKQFLEYARLDVEAMRAIHHKLPAWNYRDGEFALWCLDQKINDRGVCVDTELAAAAIRAIGDTKRQLDEDTSAATLGCVGSATQRDQLLGFILRAYGVELPDMQAATLERRIEDPELPQALKELLVLRLQTCTTSTAKYRTLLNSVCSDGRLRGTMEFCGAGRTGRWAGRKFQPTNLPSRNLPPQKDIDRGIELLLRDSAELVYDNLMKLTSACIRGCIVSSKNAKLHVSDLANIEGRVAAWLAGEDWKLRAFENFDIILGYDENGKPIRKGHDLYNLSYAHAFGILPEQVTKHQRPIGKVMELMLQYEGGVGAFITGALAYDIDLDAMAAAAWKFIPLRIIREATKAWDWANKKNSTFGLPEKTYIVCDSLKRMWREAHPAIASYWPELKQAVTEVVQGASERTCRKVRIIKSGSWLRIALPSGRSLCYAAPKVENGKISYMGMHQYSRKWTRLYTYGGKLFENLCQAVARDVMAHNMPLIEDSGYEILFTCHDEVVTEAPATAGSNIPPLSSLLSTHPPWATGLPLAAGGFESMRYRKD